MKKPASSGGLKGLISRLGYSEDKERRGARDELSFRIIYERFREILALNDSIHRLIVDIEEKTAGRSPFLIETTYQKIRKSLLDALVMIKDLNQISGDKYKKLYDVLDALNEKIEAETSGLRSISDDRLTMPLESLRASDASLAGVKMANLGEVKNVLSLNVPRGFAVTTAAFNLFMTENGLYERADQLKRMLADFGLSAIEQAARDVRQAIIDAPMPKQLETGIFETINVIKAKDARFAVRSSAVGEDLTSSHAGQYYSQLNVEPDKALLEAYKLVLASLYKTHALSYRYERGQTEAEAAMAVGFIEMISPRCAGVLFTRDFRDLDADRIEISFTAGLAEKIVHGEKNAEQITVSRDQINDSIRAIHESPLRNTDVSRLYDVARKLEAHFGSPQDIEWAIDEDDNLFILQSRRMIKAKVSTKIDSADIHDARPILEGGHTACPGAGSGPAYLIRGENDLEGFPQGAVAVALYSSPAFSKIMTRAAAIITEIGSPIGHMGILAREFGVPAIVGLAGATEAIRPGMSITVDAGSLRVYEGEIPIVKDETEVSPNLAESPSVEALVKLSQFIVPLKLTDPASPEFSPDGCRSLHDITRFVHEKLYEAMFKFGDRASDRLRNAFKLDLALPISVRIFDVGAGTTPGAGADGIIVPDEVSSIPLKAMISGLTDPRIDWKKPRNVSARGFIDVIGESMMAPPSATANMANSSFAVVSDRYMNFSIKAGYHFSTIDAYCDKNADNNYINFRFAGGGAGGERKIRRLKFLTEILSKMNFEIHTRGDLLTARLEKPGRELMLDRMVSLGRLTMCSRQLDMLMDSDSSPLSFSKAFIDGDFAKF